MKARSHIFFSFFAMLFLIAPSFTSATQLVNSDAEMSKAATIMLELYPFIESSKQRYTSVELEDLQKKTRKIKRHIQQSIAKKSYKPTTFSLSFQTIIKHFDDIDNSLTDKNVRYARALLRSTASLCSACHTQDTKVRLDHNLAENLYSPLQQADFYFMTRNYDAALTLYSDYIKTRIKIDWNIETIRSLERVLIIWLQIKDNVPAAIKYVTQIENHSNLSNSVRANLNAWKKGLNRINSTKTDAKPDKLKNIEELMYKHVISKEDPDSYQLLREDERVIAIWIRGLLNNFLSVKRSETEIPKSLFWLAIIDRALEYNIDYSLADLYLKECIQTYSKDPYAKHCYNLYKDYLEFSYSGSAGLNLPIEVKDELYKLKNLLN